MTPLVFYVIVNYANSTVDHLPDTEGNKVRLWKETNFQAIADHFCTLTGTILYSILEML